MTAYYVAHDGSDSNPGTDPNRAWRTLTYAATQFTGNQAGNTLYIDTSAPFEESVSFSVSGSSGNPAYIRPFGSKRRWTVQGTDTGDSSYVLQFLAPAYLTIEDGIIDGVDTSENVLSAQNSATGFTMRRCTLKSPLFVEGHTDAGAILRLGSQTSPVFEDCHFHDTRGDLLTTITTVGSTFRRCLFENTIYESGAVVNDGAGLHSSGVGSAVHTFELCTFRNIQGKSCVSGLVGVNNVLLVRCWFVDCYCPAWVQCVNTNSTWTVRNCVFATSTAARPAWTGSSALSLFAVASGAQLDLFNNTFINLAAEVETYCGSLTGASVLNMFNNSFYCGTTYGRFFYQTFAGETITSDYNNFYPNDNGPDTGRFVFDTGTPTPTLFAVWQGTLLHDANGKTADPDLVSETGTRFSPYNAQLNSTSDLLDCAADYSGTFTTDFAGPNRPTGADWDIGAFHQAAAADQRTGQ